MADTWKHSTIGEFKRDQFGWVTEKPSPWQGEFAVDDQEGTEAGGEVSYGSASDTLEMRIEDTSWGEESIPSPEAVAQIELLWEKHESLPPLILAYLLEDLRGEHGNRIWWSTMPAVEWPETIGRTRPESVEEIRSCLHGPSLTVRYFPEENGESLAINPFTGEPLDKPTKPRPIRPAFWAIELTFSCDWEEEHGLAVFWRNDRFIGSGYGYGQGQPPDDYAP